MPASSIMRQLIDLSAPMDVVRQKQRSAVLRDLIQEAQALVARIEHLDTLDPRAAILVKAHLRGRIDEAPFGQMLRNATGAARTAFGKTMQGAGYVNQKINQLGGLLQNTQPVQNFDQRVETVKANVAQKFPKLAAVATQYGEFAKTHPKTQAFTIGLLTAVASLATGPAGGAVAAMILRSANEMLKGEKASTAIGKAVKTGVVSWLAGYGVKQIAAGIAHAVVPYPSDFQTTYDKNPFVSWKSIYNGRVLVNTGGHTSPEMAKVLNRAFKLFTDAMYNDQPDVAGKFYKIFMDTANEAFDPSGPIQQALFAENQADMQTYQNLVSASTNFAKSMATVGRYFTAGMQGLLAGANPATTTTPTTGGASAAAQPAPAAPTPAAPAPAAPVTPTTTAAPTAAPQRPAQAARTRPAALPQATPQRAYKPRLKPANPQLWNDLLAVAQRSKIDLRNPQAQRWLRSRYRANGGTFATV